MADRVLVMHEGRLVADIAASRRRRGVGDVRRDRAGGAGMTASRRPTARDRPTPTRRPARTALARRCFVVRELGILLALVAAGRRHRGRQPAVPVRAEHQGPAARLDASWRSSRSARRSSSSPATWTCRSARSSAWPRSPPARCSLATPGAADRRWRSLVGVGARRGCAARSTAALIAAARVPALVVTLGTLYVFRGIDYSWATGQQINAADMPRALPAAGHRHRARASRCWPCSPWRSCSSPASTCAPTAAAGSCTRSAPTRRPPGWPASRSAGGSSPRSWPAARWPAWPGCCYAARFGTLDANAGIGLELNVVAAVVVGGVAIFGGSGSVYGAALGALLLTTIGSALPVLRHQPVLAAGRRSAR